MKVWIQIWMNEKIVNMKKVYCFFLKVMIDILKTENLHFIKSQEPLHSCQFIWKVVMHSWKGTTWKMLKNQKKSCTGSLGTGSDTDRTRFLVNVISQIQKYHAGTGSPIGTTRFLVQNPGTYFLRKAGIWFPVREEPVPKGLFSKILFERYFKQSFLDLKVMEYVYVDECILWTSIFKILRIIYTILTFDDFFNNSSIIFKTFIWCW